MCPQDDHDLLVYHITSPASSVVPTASSPPKPPITQVYTRRLPPPVTSPTPVSSSSADPLPGISKFVYQALAHPGWRDVMFEEMSALTANDTWELERKQLAASGSLLLNLILMGRWPA